MSETSLTRGLPEPSSSERFLSQLVQRHPAAARKLDSDQPLLSDILALVSFSPLFAATFLEHPEYITYLGRRRRDSGVRSKEELLESLAQFSSTNSQLDPHTIYSRFRRRELMRIFLRDIRHLATIAEVTEEISNLADAILEDALKQARRSADERFGLPQETDERGRSVEATFTIVSLGKLGSLELNYSSDIDLLFLFSADGTTTGHGTKGPVSNREYFSKLAETLVKLVGERSGEGGAYRVDLRLRPHGRLGSLALPLEEAVRYYRTESRPWERQVLIRSRGSAGDPDLSRQFHTAVEELVFTSVDSVQAALANVRASKDRIDSELQPQRGFDVKLGRGGIREIEFIAQALQLAFGAKDKWLRGPHTLISLSRLADRGVLTSRELTDLSSAYDFLRRTEHILQMEQGLQTHLVPADASRRALIAKKVTFTSEGDFEVLLKHHTNAVHEAFLRVFGSDAIHQSETTDRAISGPDRKMRPVSSPMGDQQRPAAASGLDLLASVSPRFSAMLATHPQLAESVSSTDHPSNFDLRQEMLSAVVGGRTFREKLASLRLAWSRLLIRIVIADVSREVELSEIKRLQTELAEASLAAALQVVREELSAKLGPTDDFALAVLALGKLGGGGMDYDSDLDLLLVYDGERRVPPGTTPQEFYGRGAELLVTTLSSMTREGSMYRVDLRLRPYGSKGLLVISSGAFDEYMRTAAAPWEMLAFVKLRAVAGDMDLASAIETRTRRAIHDTAKKIPAAELAAETRRVRAALETERSRGKRVGDVDIKYGEGGLLDVYFATRFLQLRDDVPDDAKDRSTLNIVNKLAASGSLSADMATSVSAGYEFLSSLDHNIRLTIGRSTRVPLGNTAAMSIIAARMGYSKVKELVGTLNMHRVAIRECYRKIVV